MPSVSLALVVAIPTAVIAFCFLKRARSSPCPAGQQVSPDLLSGIRHARLINEKPSSHQSFSLSDGRSLGYADYGVSTGPTVFFLHGFGDCRLTGALFDEPGRNLGARVISVDRPGWGLSSTQPGRCALDLAPDVRELAAHLDVKTFGIIAVSGGGPYALACAHALPANQLKSVTMLCATGPWDLTIRNFSWFAWSFWQIRRLSPMILRWMVAKYLANCQKMAAEQFVANTKRQYQGWLGRWPGLNEKDLAVMQNDDFLAFVFRGLSENCKRDADGVMEELRVLTTSDLGFRLEEIRKDLPIELWYGKQDVNVAWRVGEALKETIGSQTRLEVREETHLSIVLNCRDEVLQRAVRRMSE